MLDSHDAALIMWEMCSRFHWISSRRRIPRIVWIRPTAWIGLDHLRLLSFCPERTLTTRSRTSALAANAFAGRLGDPANA